MPSIIGLFDNMTPADLVAVLAFVAVAVATLVPPVLSRQRRTRDFHQRSAELKRLQDL